MSTPTPETQAPVATGLVDEVRAALGSFTTRTPGPVSMYGLATVANVVLTAHGKKTIREQMLYNYRAKVKSVAERCDANGRMTEKVAIEFLVGFLTKRVEG